MEITFGNGVPFVVAWIGDASSSIAPWGLSWPSCLTHRSSLLSFGATIATVIASSELSRIGLMLPALWIFSEVPWNPKQLRDVDTSLVGGGASPRIARLMA